MRDVGTMMDVQDELSDIKAAEEAVVKKDEARARIVDKLQDDLRREYRRQVEDEPSIPVPLYFTPLFSPSYSQTNTQSSQHSTKKPPPPPNAQRAPRPQRNTRRTSATSRRGSMRSAKP